MPPPTAPTQETPAAEEPEDTADEFDRMADEPPEPAEALYEPPEPARHRPGRPRAGEIRSPATAFFERNNATPNFRETSQYWGYRLEPITDLVATGRDKYIGIFQEPLDEDKMLKHPHFGSGVYMLMFKTRNEQGQMVLKEKLDRLDIENPDYPPCIPPGAWLADRRNERWEWAKRIYDERAKEADRKNNPPPPPPTLTVQDTIALVRQELQLGQSGNKDETVLNAVRTGLEMARATAPQQSGGDSVLLQMFTQANERADRFMQLLIADRANPKPAAGPLDEIKSVGEVIEAIDRVRPPKGYRPSDPDHPGWKILDSFVVGISPGLNALIGLLAQKAVTAGLPPKPGQQPAPKPGQQPAGAAAAPQIQQQPQEPAPAPTGEQNVQPPEVLTKHFTDALTWCLRGDAPEDFADWLNAGYPTALNDLRRIGSEVAPWSPEGVTPPLEAIMDIAKHTPAVWALIANIPNGEPRLRAFIGGVLAWTPEQEAAAEDESEGSVN